MNLIIWVTAAYGTRADRHLRWSGLFLSIGVVLAAILLGLAAGVAFGSSEEQVGDSPRKQKSSKGAKARAFFNALGQLSGVALIAVAFLVSSRDEPVWDKHAGFYVAVALPCLVGLALSTVLAAAAKLSKPARATVAVECAYQNPGIATTVALNMFEGDRASRAVGVPLYYGIVEAFGIGVFLLIAWKRGMTHAPADAPLLAVLRKNWQEINKQQAAARDVEVPPPASPVGGDAGVEAAAAVDDVAVDDVAVEPAAPLVAAPDEGPEAQDACAVA